MHKNLLFTGGNGFLGLNVIPLLKNKGFNVRSLGFQNCDINIDITKPFPELTEKIDIVFHAAGKAHSVPKTDKEIEAFYNVNYKGTKGLCEALQKSPPEYFIFISTVAVYGLNTGEDIDENYPLTGIDPYAKSKILAENYLIEWAAKNNVKLFILRPSLIAGKNAPGNLGDMIKAIKNGKYLNIAGGLAQKSILWIEDFVDIVELIIKSDRNLGIYNVCDNHQPTFFELSAKIAKLLGKKTPGNVPYFIAKSLALVGDIIGRKFPLNSKRLEKIVKPLTFSNNKIKSELGWIASNTVNKFVV
ncbi:NAD-dependent epimerase/dehydratase family protein [Niabella ginsengisoli]|uniref:NAD-dependent epimerase/dehydratase family protein n=1 Tax=Niabella ginsengisoli TaxID=522298 RepID=A0ABS9SK94_9BACT|nr:NAD-dependent epimerase/dehydratase family protein [Niabella ginsengisoli]MCH5598735.1 NAD-dependent epimerase/dehydratase family protein [Niabella ginsengisoli]